MDRASFNIDRHTPVIPPSIWAGLSPEDEDLYTFVKNKVVLPNAGLGPRGKKKRVPADDHPRVITDDILARARDAYLKLKGDLKPHEADYLKQRGHPADLFCSTALLARELGEEAAALTITLPTKLLKFASSTAVEGVSVAHWHGDLFCGFATRVLDQPAIKYAFSVPNRLCFGVDLEATEHVVVVEGLFDALAMKRLGHNVLGMGDSQPNYFKMMVASKFNRIALLLDDDLAGWMGVQKAVVILTQMLGVDPTRIEIWAVGGGHDPEGAIGLGTKSFPVISLSEAKDNAERWRRWENQQRGRDG